jgi:HK97 family phage major capsid protein
MSGSGNDSHLDDDEKRALSRAMSLTDNAGGYLVPFQLDPSVIITANGSFNQVRQIARKVIATGDVWNGVSSAGVTGSWDSEAVEVSDDAPTLAQPTITVHKLAIFVPISIEALMDAQNVAQEVSEMIAFEKDRLESVAFVTGSGTSQPFGIVTALPGVTSSVVANTSADAFEVADVYKLDEALPARYRQRASWLAHRAIYNDVRQFDTQGGASLWERLGADVPPNLLGKPAYEAEAMASSPSGTNIHFMVFGDFQNYVIADRIGTTVEFVPHLFGVSGRPTGQRGWYAYARVGGDSVNDGAFRILNGQ